MKSYLKYLFALCCILFLSQKLFPQEAQISKIDFESKFIGKQKIDITQTIPPYYKWDGFEYEIKMHLNFSNSTNFNDSIYNFTWERPDGVLQPIKINPGHIIKVSDTEYYFYFKLRTERDGWIHFYLAKRDKIYPYFSSNLIHMLHVFLMPF